MECDYSKFTARNSLLIPPGHTNGVFKGLFRGLIVGMIFSSMIAYIGVIDFGMNSDDDNEVV
jgi:tetrahydromethanopterin S-methyltransferase subunit B